MKKKLLISLVAMLAIVGWAFATPMSLSDYDTAYGTLIAKGYSVSASDLPTIESALADWETVSEEDKATLAGAEHYNCNVKDLLLSQKSLAAAAAAIIMADEFKTDHSAVLALTTETVTDSNTSAINNAISGFNALTDGAKKELAKEDITLASLTKLQFYSLHKAIINKESSEVNSEAGNNTEADYVAINAALDAYEAYDDAAVTDLTTEYAGLVEKQYMQYVNWFNTQNETLLGTDIASIAKDNYTITDGYITTAETNYTAIESLSDEDVKAAAILALASSKAIVDALKARTALAAKAATFCTTHATVLNPSFVPTLGSQSVTAPYYSGDNLSAVTAATAAYEELDAIAQDLADVADRIAELQTIEADLTSAAHYIYYDVDGSGTIEDGETDRHELLVLTTSTVTKDDYEDLVTAQSAYNSLTTAAKGYVTGVYSIAGNLNTLISIARLQLNASTVGTESSALAAAFRGTYETILALTAVSPNLRNSLDNINAAIAELAKYEVAAEWTESDIISYLKDEKELNYDDEVLLSIAEQVLVKLNSESTLLASLQPAAEADKTAYEAYETWYASWENTINLSTPNHENCDAIDGAIAAYGSLSAAAQAYAATDKSTLDALKATADADKTAYEAYTTWKATHAAVLALTVENVTATNLTAIGTALSGHESLSAAAKAYAVTEEALLKALKAVASADAVSGTVTLYAGTSASEVLSTTSMTEIVDKMTAGENNLVYIDQVMTDEEINALPDNVVAKKSDSKWYANKIVFTPNMNWWVANEIEKANEVEYVRTISGTTNYNSFALPFNCEISEDLAKDVDIYYISNVTNLGNTIDLLYNTKEVGQSVYAYMPYIIKAKKGGDHKFTATDVKLPVTSDQSVVCRSVDYKFTFTFKNQTFDLAASTVATKNYLLSGGSWKYWQTIQSGVRAQYATMTVVANAENSGKLYIRSHYGNDIVDDDATIIENVEAVTTTEGIYTINGVKVKTADKPGLYIIDGKKVMVK